jgi:hypothetical protein
VVHVLVLLLQAEEEEGRRGKKREMTRKREGAKEARQRGELETKGAAAMVKGIVEDSVAAVWRHCV